MVATDMKVYMAERRAKRRAKVFDLLGNQCSKCDSVDDLEVNHIDRTKKNFGLSGAGLDKAWTKIEEELKNCELLCKDCHQEYTTSQWSNGEITIWNKGVKGEFTHGTMGSYNEAKCRCTLCKTAKRLYRTKEIGYNDVVNLGG